MSRKPISVLCVDDSDLIAEAVESKLSVAKGFKWLGSVPNAQALLDEARRNPPDVVLLDIDMPGRDAFDAMEELATACPDARVLMLTAHVRPELIERALEAGAWGYLSKNDGAALLAAIERVCSGEFVMGPQVVEEYRRAMPRPPAHPLTPPRANGEAVRRSE